MKHNLKEIGQIVDMDLSLMAGQNAELDKVISALQSLQENYYNPYPLDPLEDGTSLVALVDYAGDDKSVVNAARVSFGGDNDEEINARDEKLINYLLDHKHGSPTEHNMLTFKVICPIMIDRQWVR